MSTETKSLTTPPMQPPRWKLLAAILLFVLSCLLLFFASLQYYWPGKWWSSAEALRWKGTALKLVKGQGHGDQGRLMIDGLAEPGVALATLSPPAFRAEDYFIVRWSVSTVKPGTKVEFLWRTTENPNRVFARELEWMGNTVAPLLVAGDTNWRGQIKELMLMAHAPLNAPLVVEAVQLDPPLGIVWREWFGAEPWLGTSINFVGENITRQWLAPLPFAVAALGLAMLGYGLLTWRKILVQDIRVVWVLVFIAWFALDMRWQHDLWKKLGLTQQRYAGKSWEEKHLAADDGRLFYLMQQIKAKLPSSTSRVFLFADDQYILGRGAYHLYPFNVLNSRYLLPAAEFRYGVPAGEFRPGDLIVILDKDEVVFDPSQQLLKWADQHLRAEMLMLIDNNILLRVL